MTVAKSNRKKFEGFPLDRFFDRHSKQKNEGNEFPAFRDIQKWIKLNTEIDDSFVYVAKSLQKAGFHKCAEYLTGIMAISQMEKSIAENPARYEKLDGRSDLQDKYLGVGLPKLDGEGTIFRTFKTQVWALCLDEAPNSVQYAERNRDKIALCNITYGQVLEYRQSRGPLSAAFKAASQKQAEDRAGQVVQKMAQRQHPLKRRPK